MSSLDETHELFDDQKSHNAGQNPKADDHISIVVVSVSFASMRMRVGMRVRMTAIFVVRMRGNRVWNQMQKRVSQKPTRSETQQDFEKRLLLIRVLLQRD